MEMHLIFGFILLLLIMSRVYQLSLKVDKVLKSNSQLRELIGEQSEIIRELKVELGGVKHLKDLPPGTKIDDIKLK